MLMVSHMTECQRNMFLIKMKPTKVYGMYLSPGIIIIVKSLPKIYIDYYREISSRLGFPTSFSLVFLPNFPL